MQYSYSTLNCSCASYLRGYSVFSYSEVTLVSRHYSSFQVTRIEFLCLVFRACMPLVLYVGVSIEFPVGAYPLYLLQIQFCCHRGVGSNLRENVSYSSNYICISLLILSFSWSEFKEAIFLHIFYILFILVMLSKATKVRNTQTHTNTRQQFGVQCLTQGHSDTGKRRAGDQTACPGI